MEDLLEAIIVLDVHPDLPIPGTYSRNTYPRRAPHRAPFLKGWAPLCCSSTS